MLRNCLRFIKCTTTNIISDCNRISREIERQLKINQDTYKLINNECNIKIWLFWILNSKLVCLRFLYSYPYNAFQWRRPASRTPSWTIPWWQSRGDRPSPSTVEYIGNRWLFHKSLKNYCFWKQLKSLIVFFYTWIMIKSKKIPIKI